MQLVECVPNFSEGRDSGIIESITREIESTSGVTLLDVDPGESTNRTVVTFIGTPEAVLEAAFKAIQKAGEVIDMRQHKGAHSRMGATDVCPFVPVTGVTMADCVELAGRLGRRVAEELKIPVYLYEEAARSPERRNLADIRSGEYEGLQEKLQDPKWRPDFGDPVFNARSGATVIGAREFLIAYNINLNTTDQKLAQQIALTLRERGRAKRDEKGRIVRDEAGRTLKIPGKFKHVKAVGWYVEDYRISQISINFTNYKISPPHLVFDEAVQQAETLGLRVTGSELVGLIPKDALLMAGRHYLEKQNRSPGLPEEELIRIAAVSLGLNDVSPFDLRKKIIEYQFKEFDPSLIDFTLREFANELSTDSPAPGGGSTAALCGALSAALTSMVANLTVGKKNYEQAQIRVKDLASTAQNLKEDLLRDIDRDTQAFNRVMEAFRLPKKSEGQKAERLAALEMANQHATSVPLEVMQNCKKALQLAGEIAECGNRNSLSDAGVAGVTARAGLESAYFNVLINLPGIQDESFAADIRARADLLRKEAASMAGEILAAIEQRLQEKSD